MLEKYIHKDYGWIDGHSLNNDLEKLGVIIKKGEWDNYYDGDFHFIYIYNSNNLDFRGNVYVSTSFDKLKEWLISNNIQLC